MDGFALEEVQKNAFLIFKSLTLRQKYGIKLWFNTVFFISNRFQNLFPNSHFCYRGLALIGRWWSG